MSSDYAQGTYFHPSQDNTARSGRKKSYKYTENEFTAELPQTDRYRHYESKYNTNDFSFEDRSEK